MTALQVPDILSLLGNMKKFKFSTTEEISFVLTSGSDTILEQSYTPGADGIITVDLKDVLRAQLSTQFSDSSIAYRQTSLVRTFTVTVGSYTYTFTVIRAGVDHLADSASNFLTSNFLTWQPNVKGVTYYSPEFLTYYAVIDSVCKCKVYVGNTSSTLTLASIPAAQAWTIPVQYAIIAGKASSLPEYYDVWIEDTAGNRLTYIQRYYAQDMKSENEQWVIFINSLGGIDTFRAYGVSENTSEHTHNIAEIDEVYSEYRVDTDRKYKKNTGYLTKSERIWLLDFFPSLQKFIYISNYVRQIVTTDSDVTYRDKELPSNYTFTYKYADAVPYLNIPRSENPTDVLNIEVPSIGSFTLAPRLVEFQRATLTDGALFPVQNPYSEGWNVTTAAALRDFMAATLTNNYNGGGGIGHTHNNLDLLQLFTFVGRYLLIEGEKIKSGTADVATFANNLAAASTDWAKILRKDKDDSTPNNFGVGKNLEVGGNNTVLGKSTLKDATFNDLIQIINGILGTKDFASSIIQGVGKGWNIDSLGNSEMESLTIRRFLEVPEIRFNRATYVQGDTIQSCAGGQIKSVTIDKDVNGNNLNTGTIEIRLEDNEIGEFDVDDICISIFCNLLDSSQNAVLTVDDGLGNRTVKGFATSMFRITSISGERNEILTYSLRGISDRWTTLYHPQPLSTIAQRGNFSKAERQSLNISGIFPKPYLRIMHDVNYWEFSSPMIGCQFGNMENLATLGINMIGYSAYLNNIYMNGTISQFESIEPKMTFNGGGDNQIAEGQTKLIKSTITNGYGIDTTDKYPYWQITRDTGDVAADNIWNAQATIENGEFYLTYSATVDDLGGKESALYTVTASDGISNPVTETISL